MEIKRYNCCAFYDENGDIGRIQRQQILMRALMEQALNPATLACPKILSVIQSHIDTNLTVEVNGASWFWSANESLECTNVNAAQFSELGQYKTSYWLPDTDRIATMMAQHFNVSLLDSEQAIERGH